MTFVCVFVMRVHAVRKTVVKRSNRGSNPKTVCAASKGLEVVLCDVAARRTAVVTVPVGDEGVGEAFDGDCVRSSEPTVASCVPVGNDLLSRYLRA